MLNVVPPVDGDSRLPAPEDQSLGRRRARVPSVLERPQPAAGVSTHPKEAGGRSVGLRDGGLSIRLERLHDRLDLRIDRDDRGIEVTRDLTDMREVLKKVSTEVEDYQRPRRSWWAVVPTNQYSFIKFL